MKIAIKTLFLIFIFLFICGCTSENDLSEYEDLMSDYEYCLEEKESIEEELEYKIEDINYLSNYIKKLETNNPPQVYNFKDTWSVKDFFNFSLYYDKEYNSLNYNLKTKDNKEIFLFSFENNTTLQNLTVTIYRSDGTFNTVNAKYDGDYLFEVPDYNYSYEIMLFATVNNNIYRATYKLSAEEIKK